MVVFQLADGLDERKRRCVPSKKDMVNTVVQEVTRRLDE